MEGRQSTISVWAWISQLWQKILFPVTSEPVNSSLPWFWSVCFYAVAALLCFGNLNHELFEPDETRYAEIPREMLAKGEWVIPLLADEAYLDKPPLFYWSVMVSYKLFGVGIWQARLTCALFCFLTLAVCLELGSLLIGRKAALAGSVMLLLCPGFLIMGKLLLLDSLITLFTVAGILTGFLAIRQTKLHKTWWTLCAFICGLGILTKGPIAVVLIGVPLFIACLLDSRFARLKPKAWFAWLLVAGFIPLPWFLLMANKQPDFFNHFFWEHHVKRFLEPFDHQRGVFFYLPILMGGMLPLVWFGWQFARKLSSGAGHAFQNPTNGFLLLAGGWCIFFFSLSGCKLPTYILPAFAPLCLAFGSFLTSECNWKPALLKFTCTAHLVLIFLIQFLLLPWYANFRSPMAHREHIHQVCRDSNLPILCYPRESNAIAFDLKRNHLKNYRSKEFDEFREVLLSQPKTVILCTHRHALQGLKQLLPDFLTVTHEYRCSLEAPNFLDHSQAKKFIKAMGETSLGLCDIAVVEHRSQETIRQASYQTQPKKLPLNLED